MAKRTGPTWSPSEHDLADTLLGQNPWLRSGKISDVLAPPLERPLAKVLWRIMRQARPQRLQLILGPRRVGKTTVMYQTVKRLLAKGHDPQRIWWYRLDHPLLMQRDLGKLARAAIDHAKAKPSKPVYLFLDELTYAEDWDHWLKTFHDDRWPVRVMGSSSSSAALKRRRYESGVGRWEEQYLAPYLFGEFLALMGQSAPIRVKANLASTLIACLRQRQTLPDLGDLRRKFLLTGGFPELLIPLKERPLDDVSSLLQSQQTLRSDAVERALYKDIPQVFGVDNPRMLERVLYTLAGQIGVVLSPSNICQSVGGLSQPTFDRYLGYLEQAFLVFTLENYAGSELAKQKRGRKLYFVDSAVRNASLQRGIGPLQDPGEMGLLLENMSAGHLHALGQQSQVRLYYWRDKDDEIDFVYDHPSAPLAFQIGSSASHHRHGLAEFTRRFPRFRNRCYYVAPVAAATLPSANTSGIGSLPLDLFLLAISAQADYEQRQRLLPTRQAQAAGWR